jgi:hypothetical protein
MDGASGSHSFWGSALRDLLAGLARFRSPEFDALLTGFIAIAIRLRNSQPLSAETAVSLDSETAWLRDLDSNQG